jgi:dihydrofolate reductase
MTQSPIASAPIISIVVAVADNGIIGFDGDMPWQLSTDLKRFKTITMGKPIIMGRKTYESIGRPLPGRLNVVISRDKNYNKDRFPPEQFQIAESLKTALEFAQDAANKSNIDEICIIGGGQIYRQAMELAQKLYVTHVELTPKGDTSFPPIDENWQIIHEETVPMGEKDSASSRYVIYER